MMKNAVYISNRLLQVIGHRPLLTGLVGIGDCIVTSEAAKLHLAVLPGLDTRLGLPNVVDQVV